MTFDREILKASLEPLTERQRAVFAVSCAERIRHCYACYAVSIGSDESRLDVLVGDLWENLSCSRLSKEAMCEYVNACTELLRDADEGAWTDLRASGEDAAAAAAYAWRVLESGATDDAAWAASLVYESLFRFILDQATWAARKSAWKWVDDQPLTHLEVTRQQQDIADLSQMGPRDPSAPEIASFRKRSAANRYLVLTAR